jgi:hypothetical protein
MKLIALSGQSGSGKDYLADNVLRPLGFYRWAIAWPMKNQVVARRVCTWEEAHKDKPDDVRQALQLEGTELGWMQHGRMYWCEMAAAWMRTMEEYNGLEQFVLTDVRFPHEVEWVESLEGVVIRLQALHRVQQNGLSPAARLHPSEAALNGYIFEHNVDNDVGEDGEKHLQDLVFRLWPKLAYSHAVS